MKRQQLGLYAVALSILVVGLVWAGVPASALLLAGLVLICPLMMLVMMRFMPGDGSGHEGHGVSQHDRRRHGEDDGRIDDILDGRRR